MDKGLEYTFFQRRYTNNQYTHEKINITNGHPSSLRKYKSKPKMG